jgi:hypothetical protein
LGTLSIRFIKVPSIADIRNKENSMFKQKTLRFALLTLFMALAVNLALPDLMLAKDKRWQGRFNDKKAEKFINGHDARDGRWDGRGPRARFIDRRDRFDFRDRRDRFDFRDRRDRFDFIRARRDRFDFRNNDCRDDGRRFRTVRRRRF